MKKQVVRTYFAAVVLSIGILVAGISLLIRDGFKPLLSVKSSEVLAASNQSLQCESPTERQNGNVMFIGCGGFF